MMRRWLKIAAGIVGLVLALGAAGFGYFVYSPEPAEPTLTAEIADATIKVGERERSYLAYVPKGLAAGAPLLIVLHGSAMDGSRMRRWTGYEFDKLADARRFAVYYPDGYKGNWNDCRRASTTPAKLANIDDVGFIQALIARAWDQLGIDRRRVYLFGYSNGATMAFRLAMEHPLDIAAIAAISANLESTPQGSSCPQEGATSPVMMVDGTQDPINPFEGGEVTLFGFASRGFAMSTLASAQVFARRNGLIGPPIEQRLPHRNPDDPTSVDRSIWLSDGRPFVVLDVVNGGGHVVPQPGFRFPRLLGRTTQDLDAPAEAVEFFGLK